MVAPHRRAGIPTARLVFVAALLAVSCAPSFAQSAADDAPTTAPLFLWTIRSSYPSDGESYLFGTVHLNDRRLHPVAERLDPLLGKVTAVYREVAFMRDEPDYGRIRDGRSLRSMLSDDDWTSLSALLSRHKYAESSVRWFQPWIAREVVDGIRARLLHTGPILDDMVDKKVGRLRVAGGGLEGEFDYYGTIQRHTEEELIQLLREAVDQAEAAERDPAAVRAAWAPVVDAYLTGSEEAVMAVMLPRGDDADELDRRFVEINLRGRNPRMADRIEMLVAHSRGKRYLFYVGVLHLVGEDSVVAILRRKGFRVERADVEAIIHPPDPAAASPELNN